MKTVWTTGLSPEKKGELKLSFLACADVRERLKHISTTKINQSRKKRVSEDAYQSPNWAYQQADACGYERALEEIISLLES